MRCFVNLSDGFNFFKSCGCQQFTHPPPVRHASIKVNVNQTPCQRQNQRAATLSQTHPLVKVKSTILSTSTSEALSSQVKPLKATPGASPPPRAPPAAPAPSPPFSPARNRRRSDPARVTPHPTPSKAPHRIHPPPHLDDLPPPPLARHGERINQPLRHAVRPVAPNPHRHKLTLKA
jgi:hypothetical protein